MKGFRPLIVVALLPIVLAIVSIFQPRADQAQSAVEIADSQVAPAQSGLASIPMLELVDPVESFRFVLDAFQGERFWVMGARYDATTRSVTVEAWLSAGEQQLGSIEVPGVDETQDVEFVLNYVTQAKRPWSGEAGIPLELWQGGQKVTTVWIEFRNDALLLLKLQSAG